MVPNKGHQMKKGFCNTHFHFCNWQCYLITFHVMWHSFDFFYQSWPSPIKSVSVIRVVHSLCYNKRTVHSIWSMVSSTLQSMSDGNGLSATIFFKHRQIRPCPQESGYFENGAILSVFLKKVRMDTQCIPIIPARGGWG